MGSCKFGIVANEHKEYLLIHIPKTTDDFKLSRTKKYS